MWLDDSIIGTTEGSADLEVELSDVGKQQLLPQSKEQQQDVANNSPQPSQEDKPRWRSSADLTRVAKCLQRYLLRLIKTFSGVVRQGFSMQLSECKAQQ